MTATPTNHGNPGAQDAAMAGAARATFGQASAGTLGIKWSALHDAAGVVAAIARAQAEPMPAKLREFPAIMRDAGGWRRELAEQGVQDLAAIMEPGLAALLAVHARGADAAPAALALWQEFRRARDVIAALIPPSAPLRSA